MIMVRYADDIIVGFQHKSNMNAEYEKLSIFLSFLSSRPEEFHPRALPGRVGDWLSLLVAPSWVPTPRIVDMAATPASLSQ
jgi:hypothetical protein